MGEFSIAVERVGIGVHLFRCAGDLDRTAGAHVARLIDHVPGLVHAIVDLGNVRSYAEHALDPFHDDRVIVIGVTAHLMLLPGRVAAELAGLRTARDLDGALAQLQRTPAAVMRTVVPYPRDRRRGITGATTPV
ncbi:hypothetical protein ACQEVB_35320 [Pseudonocardia sp. CA-107938]|uniref:hypothetical protein n=1 Tax=Pseudonocardia sp. CA-107938 TaxID=3240021 RepID=UPI003D8C616A